MPEKCDVLITGAGILGLAVGRELARAGREVLIVEQHDAIGTETSSRNSEVIHAGIYYPTNSIKAKFCVRGKQLLYEHCERYNVPHENIGKVIVATDESQFDVLRAYQKQALINGVGELPWLNRATLKKMEPEVECLGGVYSPTTGIIDSHAFMLSLEGDFEAAGGMIAFLTPVTKLRYKDSVIVDCGGMELSPNLFVNAAGLEAPQLSRQVGGEHEAHYARGRYYTLSGRSPFSRLVYPIAEEGGLGVHVTLDLSHQARFGPDVQWIDSINYEFDSSHYDEFVDAIRRYYPTLDESRLNEGYTGIRPKLRPQGAPASDFVINGPRETKVPGYVELLGIESPGLTASLAIAEHVAEMSQY